MWGMSVNGMYYLTIRVKEYDEKVIQVMDQRYLPHKFVIENLHSPDDKTTAIKEMGVRRAGTGSKNEKHYVGSLIYPN